MNFVGDFFKQLDGRIFSYNFARLFSWSYLLESKPATFFYQNWAIVLAVILIAVSAIAFVMLRKRREQIRLEKEQRFAFARANKINFVLFVILLILVLLRTQGVMYLSMRLLTLLVLIAALVNSLIAAYLAFLLPKVKAKTGKSETLSPVSSDDYQKYLPKKNKKKK
jgi:small-conductance mechanosensitive channel